MFRKGEASVCSVWISLYSFLVSAHQLNQIQISETASILKQKCKSHSISMATTESHFELNEIFRSLCFDTPVGKLEK